MEQAWTRLVDQVVGERVGVAAHQIRYGNSSPGGKSGWAPYPHRIGKGRRRRSCSELTLRSRPAGVVGFEAVGASQGVAHGACTAGKCRQQAGAPPTLRRPHDGSRSIPALVRQREWYSKAQPTFIRPGTPSR